MGDDLEENFISALRKVGFKAGNVKWMISLEATKGFFQWFGENIDSSNYLSEEELNEYYEIEASGCVLEGDDLNSELEKIIPDLDEIDGNETQVLQYLRTELAKVESTSLGMKNLLDDLRLETSSLDSQISQLDRKKKGLLNKCKNDQEMYYKNLADLSVSMKIVGQNIDDVIDHCEKMKGRVQVKKLIAEFSPEFYEKERDLVEDGIKKRKEELSLLCHQQQNSKLQIEKWRLEINNLRKRYENTLLLKLKLGSERQGLEHSIAWLRQHCKRNTDWVSLFSSSSIRKLRDDATQRLLSLKQDLGKLEKCSEQSILSMNKSSSGLWKESMNAVQAHVLRKEQNLECLIHEIFILRESQSLKLMSDVIHLEENLLSKKIVLQMLLDHELNSVSTTLNVISSVTKTLDKLRNDWLKRMELMKSVKQRRDIESQRIESYPLLSYLSGFLAQYSSVRNPVAMLSSTLSEHISNESISSIMENLLSCLENMRLKLANVEDSFLHNVNQQNLLLYTSYREALKLKKRIYSSSSSKEPVTYSVKGLRLMYSIYGKDEDDFEVKLKKLRRLLEKSKNSELLNKLWVIFHTDPGRMKEILPKEERESLDDKELSQ